MTFKKLFAFGLVAAVLVACGDDSSSNSATNSDEDSSSSVCEDCDGSNSSKAKSSSSSAKSSSSSAKSSNSVASSSSVPEGYVDPSTVVMGTMTDERDGQTYKTVEIGTQTWMAENLNYESADSYCYNRKTSNCSKYGRLYTWSAAMDSEGKWTANGWSCGYWVVCSPTYPVRGVCPEGWHLPDTTEWNALFTAVGGISMAEEMLKSTSGWPSDRIGTDAYSFSALPAGYYNGESTYKNEGSHGYFWSSTELITDGYFAYYTDLAYFHSFGIFSTNNKYRGYSVRCVKDSITPNSSSKIGTMTDSRDNQTYKTVKIGTQTWMAENLNYAYTDVPFNYCGDTSDSTSWCYGNNSANCAKYGRLYTWAAAMDSVGLWTTNGKGCGLDNICSPTYPVRGICPKGWHLPDTTEWNMLFSAVGGDTIAGAMLKSASGWRRDGNGIEANSFSALPAGYASLSDDDPFKYEGEFTSFWSSTEDGSYACDVKMWYNYIEASVGNSHRYHASSVRCVKD